MVSPGLPAPDSQRFCDTFAVQMGLRVEARISHDSDRSIYAATRTSPLHGSNLCSTTTLQLRTDAYNLRVQIRCVFPLVVSAAIPAGQH